MENTAQFKSFLTDVKSTAVGLNFDIGHFFCAGEDPAAAFEELFEWVGHVHLEDIASNRIHNHLIPGQGAIQFLNIFRTMVKLGYRQDISLELYPYVDAPEVAGRESLDILRPLFQKAGLEINGI
jgi:sugar phosphate isomerase/epimerase